MGFKSTTTFTSALEPSLSFKLRKMSFGRRLELNALAADANRERRELSDRVNLLLEGIDTDTEAAKLSPCTCSGHEHVDFEVPEEEVANRNFRCSVAKCDCRKPETADAVFTELTSLRLKIWNEVVVAKLYPLLIRWAVIEVNWEIDDEKATVDSFLALAHDELVVEVGSTIESLTKMSYEQQENFKSPGTSNAPVTGPTENTTA